MHLKNLVYLVHVDSTNSPPPPCGLTWTFHEPPLPPSGPHGLRMTPYGIFQNFAGMLLDVTTKFMNKYKTQIII